MIEKLDVIKKFLEKKPELSLVLTPIINNIISTNKEFEERNSVLQIDAEEVFKNIYSKNENFVNFDLERYESAKNTVVFSLNHIYLFIVRRYSAATTLLYALYNDENNTIDVNFLIESIDKQICFGGFIKNFPLIIKNIFELLDKSFDIIKIQSSNYENANWSKIYETKLFLDKVSLMLIGEVYANEAVLSESEDLRKKEVQYNWDAFLKIIDSSHKESLALIKT